MEICFKRLYTDEHTIKIMDWSECLGSSVAKKVAPDNEMVKSLILSANNKLKTAESIETNEITAGSKLSLAYDSLRETLEALAIKTGYKIYNHECYTCFIREIMHKTEEAQGFDRLRRIRNKVNYYGQSLSVDEITSLIKEIKDLRKIVIQLMK